MSKKQVQQQELEEALRKICESKAPLSPKTRRYTAKEKDQILLAVEKLGLKPVAELSGVRDFTINIWLRRRKPASEKISEDHYDGYHPNWQKVLDLWKSRPGLGPAQIANQLKRDGLRISVSTVRNILEENGYTPPKALIKPERVFRYEAARPRELIHMDFKHFYINKQKVFLLLMQDDYSRFLCGYKLTNSENMDSVIEVFENCVNKYGRMQIVMTDAGSSFYSWNGINRFQKLISEESGVDHIKASSPRSNGKVESVNKQIEKELLRVKEFSSLEEAELGVDEWIEFYNFERTHMGLPPGEVPADRFLLGWNHKPEKTSVTSVPQVAPLSPATNVWEDILKVALTKIK
jgi:putative transposase